MPRKQNFPVDDHDSGKIRRCGNNCEQYFCSPDKIPPVSKVEAPEVANILVKHFTLPMKTHPCPSKSTAFVLGQQIRDPRCRPPHNWKGWEWQTGLSRNEIGQCQITSLGNLRVKISDRSRRWRLLWWLLAICNGQLAIYNGQLAINNGQLAISN